MPNTLPNQIKRNIAEDSITKDIRNLFKSERKNNSNVDRIIRNIRTLLNEKKKTIMNQ